VRQVVVSSRLDPRLRLRVASALLRHPQRVSDPAR
jgi:hypothetical protein